MSRKKVVYVGGFELPDKNAAAHRVVSNSRILRKLGFDVVLIGIDKEGGSPSLSRCGLDYFGFESWRLPYPSGKVSWFFHILGDRSLLEYINKEMNGISCIVAYNYPFVAQLRMYLLCRKLGVPMISDATEWYDSSAGSYFFRIVKWLDVTCRMYLMNSLVAGLMTTGKYLTQYYVGKGKKVVELPTLYSSNDEDRQPKTANGKKKFVYVGVPFDVGRINSKKTNLKERLDLIVDAFFKLQDLRSEFSFDVYGVSLADYLTVFPEQRVLLEEMSDCITFHGKVRNVDARRAVAASDFSIFIRDRSLMTLAGFPSKYAESITLGTPVVTNRMLSLENYIDPEFVFLVNPNFLEEELRELMCMSDGDIESASIKAFSSRMFDYQNYISKVDQFVKDVGLA